MENPEHIIIPPEKSLHLRVTSNEPRPKTQAIQKKRSRGCIAAEETRLGPVGWFFYVISADFKGRTEPPVVTKKL